jgi:hypothetical protein
MMIQPEQMSLMAHQHIQNYLASISHKTMSKEDLNAVLRLSQHLRVFGLLSAAAYINQINTQEGKEGQESKEGKVRLRTLPVWKLLLGELINSETPPSKQELRDTIVQMARDEPAKYMATWRKAMILSNHWNFWAKAYSG